MVNQIRVSRKRLKPGINWHLGSRLACWSSTSWTDSNPSCQSFHQLAILLMSMENWRLIKSPPRVTGTIPQMYTPCAVFPVVFNYILKDVPSFTRGKASSHFGCASRRLIEEACWWGTDDGRTPMRLWGWDYSSVSFSYSSPGVSLSSCLISSERRVYFSCFCCRVSDVFSGSFTSMSHTAWLWCHDWTFSLAGPCLPAVLERYNWTAGSKGNVKLVVTHLLPLCYYIISSPAMISIDPKFHEIRPKKPKICVCFRKMENVTYHVTFTFYRS